MAYDPDHNQTRTTVHEYNRTIVEREGSGATWIVIGLLFAAVVAAIFFLFRPSDPSGIDGSPAIVVDPVSQAPSGAPAADVDVNIAPADTAPDDAASDAVPAE